MITRPILEAQRVRYVKDQEVAIANVNALNGAIEAIDNLLTLCAQEEAARVAADAATKEGEPHA